MSGLPLCRSTSVCLSFRSVGLIVCPSALLVCLFVYLSVVVRLSLLSAGLSVCLFVCLFVCLSVCPSVCMSVCRSIRSVGLSGLSVCQSLRLWVLNCICVHRLAVEDTDDDMPALDQSF